jgi:ABC-type lipoprotein release transport system permease subunit
MQLNQLAWRNLLRHKRRTLITCLSVAFGVLLSVTFTGSGDYSYTSLINTSTTMGFGHLTVEPQGYNDTPSLSMRVLQANAIANQIQEVPNVQATYVRIMCQAMFAAGAKSVGGMFLAIDPEKENSNHNFFLKNINQGNFFTESDGRGIVIGAKMAEKLNLRLGKKLIYTMTDKDGEIISEISRVKGIFTTGDDTIDSTIVLLPIDRIRAALRYENDAASLIAVFISDQRDAKLMQQKLNETLHKPELEVMTWEQTQADLAGLIAIDRASNYLMQFLVGLLIAAGIVNTMLMSVLERTREFGMMMAVGMSPRHLVRMILIESFWIGIIGLILGIVITAPWYIYMSHNGIDLSILIGNDYSAGGVLVDPVMKLRLFKESAFAILASVFLLAIAAGLYPAWKAGRIPPLASIRNV